MEKGLFGFIVLRGFSPWLAGSKTGKHERRTSQKGTVHSTAGKKQRTTQGGGGT